jgi:L-asparaginase II
MLRKIGCTEQDLACGPHPPLSTMVAEQVLRAGKPLTPRWSNCSGKHTGMLALALHHGWPTREYARAGHPVQRRILACVSQWTGREPAELSLAVDGCTAVCFGLPLQAMATAYAQLGVSPDPSAVAVRDAMMGHPLLIAGLGRLCTDLMEAFPGRVLAKLGADGIYCAAVPEARLGVALKVEDGDMRTSSVALLAILAELSRHGRAGPEFATLTGPVARHAEVPIVNTRGEQTGELRPAGRLRFHEQGRS